MRSEELQKHLGIFCAWMFKWQMKFTGDKVTRMGKMILPLYAKWWLWADQFHPKNVTSVPRMSQTSQWDATNYTLASWMPFWSPLPACRRKETENKVQKRALEVETGTAKYLCDFWVWKGDERGRTQENVTKTYQMRSGAEGWCTLSVHWVVTVQRWGTNDTDLRQVLSRHHQVIFHRKLMCRIFVHLMLWMRKAGMG